jgi:serine phosphatase RsbU (regulator of sigma subunit)
MPFRHRTKFERNLFVGFVLIALAVAAVSVLSLFMARHRVQNRFLSMWEASGTDVVRDDLAFFARQRLDDLAVVQAELVRETALGCSSEPLEASLDCVLTKLGADGGMPQGLEPQRLQLYRKSGETWDLVAEHLAGVGTDTSTPGDPGGLSSRDLGQFVLSGTQPKQRNIGVINSLISWPSSSQDQAGEYLLAASASTDSAFSERWRRSRANVDRPSFTLFFSDLIWRQSIWLLLALLPITFAAVLASRILSSRVSRPLANLVGAMERVSEGNLSYRAPGTSQEEFGFLVESFNSMAANIQRLNEETRNAARLKRELEMAREIQLKSLPDTIPQCEGFDLFATNVSSLEVSGDFYDAFEVKREDALVLAIGDVSGKGIPAALVMAESLACLHTLADGGSGGLCEWVKMLNRLLCSSTQAGFFVTLFLAVLYPKEKKLVYVNGGHNPPLVCRVNGELVQLDPGGPLVGALPQAQYESGEIMLHSGDILLMYTDGITEAVTPAGEEYGEERLGPFLRESSGRSAETIAQQLVDQVRSHTGLKNQADDMTLLVLNVTDGRKDPAEC